MKIIIEKLRNILDGFGDVDEAETTLSPLDVGALEERGVSIEVEKELPNGVIVTVAALRKAVEAAEEEQLKVDQEEMEKKFEAEKEAQLEQLEERRTAMEDRKEEAKRQAAKEEQRKEAAKAEVAAPATRKVETTPKNFKSPASRK